MADEITLNCGLVKIIPDYWLEMGLIADGLVENVRKEIKVFSVFK